MPSNFSFGKIEFNLAPSTGARRVDPEEPFRLLVIADLSGRSSRKLAVPLAGRKPVRVDIDNFETVMGRLGAELCLSFADAPGQDLKLSFATVEDFHPDALLRRVPALSAWADLRRRLADRSTVAEATAEVQRLLGAAAAPAIDPEAAPKTASAPGESTADTLARLLGKASEAGASSPGAKAGGATTPAQAGVQALLRSAVASSIVPGATVEESVCRQAVDEELTRRLRAILHHGHFQALEAAWRGVDKLLREFGGEENIKVSLLDATREEIEADLKASDDLAASGLFRGLRDTPWAVIVTDLRAETSVADIEVLGRLAKIGRAFNCPVLAGASEGFVGCRSLVATPDPDDWNAPLAGPELEAWTALRKLPEAQNLGLALPRVMMRLPFGKGGDTIDGFPFEEIEPGRPHGSFLWGNPSFACGFILAEAFRSEGWDAAPIGAGQVGELPVYRFTVDGETAVTPCAEVWLSDRAAEQIQARGPMAVQSIKGRDAIRVGNLQSVSATEEQLAFAGVA